MGKFDKTLSHQHETSGKMVIAGYPKSRNSGNRKPRPGILRPGMTIHLCSQSVFLKLIVRKHVRNLYMHIFSKRNKYTNAKKKEDAEFRGVQSLHGCALNPVPYSASKWPFTFGQETTKYEISFLQERG